jgi:hypothetical protein
MHTAALWSSPMEVPAPRMMTSRPDSLSAREILDGAAVTNETPHFQTLSPRNNIFILAVW